MKTLLTALASIYLALSIITATYIKTDDTYGYGKIYQYKGISWKVPTVLFVLALAFGVWAGRIG